MSGEEFPLTIPPAQNPDAVIFGRGARERPEALFQRKPVKKLMSQLNDTPGLRGPDRPGPPVWLSPDKWRLMSWGVSGGEICPDL